MISSAVILLAALVGLALGSFCATLAIRMTRREQAILGRSACDNCGVKLSFLETAPVVGFAIHRGQCRSCSSGIDPHHLVGEVCGAAIAITALWVQPSARGLAIAGIEFCLLTTAIVDLRTQKLPDIFAIVIASLGVAMATAQGAVSLISGIAASGVSIAILEALRLWGRRSGRPSLMGAGDMKLIGALALWLGIATPWMVFGAAAAGLVGVIVMRPKDGKISFGPFIAISASCVGLLCETHVLSVAG